MNPTKEITPMTRYFRKALAATVLLALMAFVIGPASRDLIAQTGSLYTTTLGAALASPAQGSGALTITLASGTNVAVGQGLVVDGEYMTIQSSTPQTTRWNVVRGQSGTIASAHPNAAPVLFGAPNMFGFGSSAGPSGSCVSTAQPIPYVLVGNSSTSIFSCAAVNTLTGSTAATWAQITQNGQILDQESRYTGWTYTSAGALTIQPGIQFIGSSGALSMTLASPATWQNGLVMILYASTAQAHVVTYTPGFFGTTTSSDVATFGGAIGDNITIVATNGVWRAVRTRNVTIA